MKLKNIDIKSRLTTDLERNTDWIKTADQKIGIFLAFQGLIISQISPYYSSWVKLNQFPYNAWKIFNAQIGILLLLIGIFLSVYSLISKLIGDRKKNGLIFFGDVNKLDSEKYKELVLNQTEEDYINDLQEQVYTTAVMAFKKHTSFRHSMILSLAGIAIICIMLIFY